MAFGALIVVAVLAAALMAAAELTRQRRWTTITRTRVDCVYGAHRVALDPGARWAAC